MFESMQGLKRTHMAGELSAANVGEKVVVMGWVNTRRDHGGLIFIDVRDRSGLVQLVFSPEVNNSAFQKAEKVRSEYVLAAVGEVRKRSDETINPKLKTGEIEIFIDELRVLNSAKTPPFYIEEDVDVDENIRLKYRYLDLRRPDMQSNIRLRYKVTRAVREFLDKKGFLEIETPMLTNSTPEGARDYLVPSRVNPGTFYALPQSPQTFKQILMVSGMDKYFQVARCFRDEDLRADRQPEFTQANLYTSGSIRFFFLANSILNAPKEAATTEGLSATKNNKSPGSASNLFRITSISSCLKNLSIGDFNPSSVTTI